MRSNQDQGTRRSGQQSLRPTLRTERAASALSCSDRIVSRAQCMLARCRLSPALGSHGPTSTPSSRFPYATEARRLLTRCVPSLTSSHTPHPSASTATQCIARFRAPARPPSARMASALHANARHRWPSAFAQHSALTTFRYLSRFLTGLNVSFTTRCGTQFGTQVFL